MHSTLIRRLSAGLRICPAVDQQPSHLDNGNGHKAVENYGNILVKLMALFLEISTAEETIQLPLHPFFQGQLPQTSQTVTESCDTNMLSLSCYSMLNAHVAAQQKMVEMPFSWKES